jgi:hypothetical protein
MPCDPKRQRGPRFLRLSVRAMLALVVVVGLWFGWLARSAKIQRDAVAAVEGFDCQATYYWGSMQWIDSRAEPWWPRWLEDLIGIDCLDRVVGVDVRAITIIDAPLIKIIDGSSLVRRAA